MKLEIILDELASNDFGAQSFSKAIQSACKRESLDYSILSHPSFENPYILLTPNNFKSSYKDHILQLDKYTTANICESLCKENESKNILLLGKGKTVNMPLMGILEFSDYRFDYIDSKTAQSDILNKINWCDTIVCGAPFGKQFNFEAKDKIVIDAGNNMADVKCRKYINFKEIGKLTVKKIIDDYISMIKEN